jgi:putative nucleotidyltransferase with HDIG domain
MEVLRIFSVTLAAAGAAVILSAIALGLKIRKDVTEPTRRRWLFAIFLMVMSVAGYALFVLAMLGKVPFIPEVVAGGMVFVGACFVYLFVHLTGITIRQIGEKDRDLSSYARGLTARTVELEREITERIHAEEQDSLHIQYLSALHEIDMVIGSSLDLKVNLGAFLERSVSQLRVDAACVLLADPRARELKYAAGLGFRTPVIEGTSLKPGNGSAGLAALERRTVSIPVLSGAVESFGRGELLEAEGFVAYYAVPLIAKGEVKGVLEVYNRKPFAPGPEWTAFLEALALQAAIAIENATLFEDVQRTNTELIRAYDTTLEGWARALELRDEQTEGHTQRVVEMTLRMAEAMGMQEELEHVRRGALLHDIGKMSIPDSVLLKDGPLTEEEWEIMRRHPTYAFELLSPIAYLRPALDIPYCHHEKFDGTGYPRGLKGENIPLAARIFAVVDMWDALCSERRYQPAWSREKTCGHIISLAGAHFDPRVVEAFIRMECEP